MTAAAPRFRNAAETRARILSEARREFSRAGFAGATVRAIASAAEVSPNLITRYFGGKEGLFVAATEVHLELDPLFNGPRDTLGERLARSMVDRWVGMPGADPLLTLLRASGERPEAATALSAFLDQESFEPLRLQLIRYGMTDSDATSRARAVDVFALGISARHRVLRDDLGDPAQAIVWIAATIQRLIDAP